MLKGLIGPQCQLVLRKKKLSQKKKSMRKYLGDK